MVDTPYQVRLSVMTQNDNLSDEFDDNLSNSSDKNVRSVIVQFKSQENYHMHEDMMFDELLEPINEWLQNYYPGEYVDDTIETWSEVKVNNPDIVL